MSWMYEGGCRRKEMSERRKEKERDKKVDKDNGQRRR